MQNRSKRAFNFKFYFAIYLPINVYNPDNLFTVFSYFAQNTFWFNSFIDISSSTMYLLLP